MKTQISLHIRESDQESSLITCAFYSLGAIQRRDAQEPLSYWVNVEADKIKWYHAHILGAKSENHLNTICNQQSGLIGLVGLEFNGTINTIKVMLWVLIIKDVKF